MIKVPVDINSRQIVLNIGKLMVFAAWADGEIQKEEYEVICDQIHVLPDITEDEWSSIAVYMEYPVADTELVNLVNDFDHSLRSKDDRMYAIHAIERVIVADGVITEVEEQSVILLKEALESSNFVEEVLAILKKIMNLARERRRTQASSTYSRQDDMDDFLNNPVFFKLSKIVNSYEEPLCFTKAQLKKLCLAGAIMACLVKIDYKIDASEVDVMMRVLRNEWLMSEGGANLVLSIALNKQYGNMDLLRICRHFYSLSEQNERLSLIKVLIQIMESDGEVSKEELQTIQTVAAHMKIHETALF